MKGIITHDQSQAGASGVSYRTVGFTEETLALLKPWPLRPVLSRDGQYQ